MNASLCFILGAVQPRISPGEQAMVYTAESLPDNLYTGLDIQPG